MPSSTVDRQTLFAQADANWHPAIRAVELDRLGFTCLLPAHHAIPAPDKHIIAQDQPHPALSDNPHAYKSGLLPVISVLALKLDRLQVPEWIATDAAFVIGQLVGLLLLLLRGRFFFSWASIKTTTFLRDGLASRATMSLVSGGLATSPDSIDFIGDKPSSHRHHWHLRDCLPLT